MKIAIVIPAHNEEEFIRLCLLSLCKQTFLPCEVLVVDDNSSDTTAKIVTEFTKQYDFIHLIHHSSSNHHDPGSKIINAFNYGLKELKCVYDVICKFDADLIFPENYLEKLNNAFLTNPQLGMYAGFCYVKKNEVWQMEGLTNQDHIRGALKSYSKKCFEDIGGLKKEMGWDTVDEMLARFYGWETQTNENLAVKHLKPTGQFYASSLANRYGKALYKMDFRFWLSFLSILKLAYLKKSVLFFFRGILSYLKSAWFSQPKKMVEPDQGKFIRAYRWKKMKNKFGV